jgi:hypothetical protein
VGVASVAEGESIPTSDGDDVPAAAPPRTDQRLIIRLWVDQASAEDRNPRWYGQIVNIAGGEPRYVRRLSEIGEVVVSVLEGMGVRFRWHQLASRLRRITR